MKYIPLATLLITAPLLSQDAVRVEDQRAIGLEDTSDPRYLGPPLRVPVVTYQQLPMLKAAGLSATEEESVSRWSAIQVPMQRAIGFGPLELTPEPESAWVFFGTTPSGVEYSVISIPWPEAMVPVQSKDDSGQAEQLDNAQSVEVEESSNEWTAEQLPMQRAAGISLDDFIDVPDVREREVSDDSSYSAEKLRMQQAIEVELYRNPDQDAATSPGGGFGAFPGESPADKLARLRIERLGERAAWEAIQHESNPVVVRVNPDKISSQKLQWPGQETAASEQESFTAEQLPMQRAIGLSEKDSSSYTAEQLPMQKAAGVVQLEQESTSYTAEKLRMQRAAGLGELEQENTSYTAEKLRMQRAIGVQPTQSSDEDSSGSKGGVQPYPFESPAEKLARLRAERLGRDAAKQAIRDFADAIEVQVSPDKVQIQALANALKPIGFEEFADELDRTEPTLIIDYWFPRLWTRVLDHQLARSVEGLEASQGARELFIDVRQLLREREVLTRDSETHQRLDGLLNAAEVAGTDSQAFQDFQVQWTKVRMQRAIGLARQDRERTGLVSPTVRQRVTQLRGELGAIRATDQ